MDYFDKRDNVSLCEDGTDVPNVFADMDSKIQEFYENKNVLITDASGLGTLLAERLLRSCPKIRTIYLLMKTNNNRSYEERVDEVFLSKIYNKISITYQHPKKKIKIIHGDFFQPCCGISELDQEMLINEIHVVFHCPGTSNKYENLKNLYCINIQSTNYFLELASKMKKIKAFIYVSTINVSKQHPGDEKFHETVFSENDLKSWKENIAEEQLQAIAPKIAGGKGGLSGFTKVITEEIVHKHNGKIAIAIARSSNDVGSQKDNMLNWKNLFNLSTEPDPVLVNALKFYRYGISTNSTPVDSFVNTLIAISWQIGTCKSIRDETNTPVYDVVPSWKVPTDCGEHLTEDTNLIYGAISKQYLESNKVQSDNNKWKYYQKKYIYPVLFLLMLDLYLKIYGNTYKLLNTFVKSDDYNLPSEYDSSQSWNNKHSNVDKLWSSMSYVDKKLFNFDIITYKQERCDSRNIRNIIAHLFKEDSSDFEIANGNYTRYHNIKKCLKILLFGACSCFIINRYFLSLLQCLNQLFL